VETTAGIGSGIRLDAGLVQISHKLINRLITTAEQNELTTATAEATYKNQVS